MVYMKLPKNISQASQGFTVRFVRAGEETSKYFRFSDGGKKKALQRARIWREQQLKKLGPRQWKSGPRKKASNNSSGVTGVSKNLYGRWVASWQSEGRQQFKSFPTRKEAIAHRKSMCS